MSWDQTEIEMAKRDLKKKKFEVPLWMLPYLEMLGLDKDDAEDYMNCDSKNCNVFSNAPRALMCTSASAKVSTLLVLHKEGRIA